MKDDRWLCGCNCLMTFKKIYVSLPPPDLRLGVGRELQYSISRVSSSLTLCYPITQILLISIVGLQLSTYSSCPPGILNLQKQKPTQTHFTVLPRQVRGCQHQRSPRCFPSVLNIHNFIFHQLHQAHSLTCISPTANISCFQFSWENRERRVKEIHTICQHIYMYYLI